MAEQKPAALPARTTHSAHSARDASDKVSTVNLSEIIEAHPCAALVDKLEECMGENDRVWSKCQQEVKELRKCNQQHPK